MLLNFFIAMYQQRSFCHQGVPVAHQQQVQICFTRYDTRYIGKIQNFSLQDAKSKIGHAAVAA